MLWYFLVDIWLIRYDQPPRFRFAPSRCRLSPNKEMLPQPSECKHSRSVGAFPYSARSLFKLYNSLVACRISCGFYYIAAQDLYLLYGLYCFTKIFLVQNLFRVRLQFHTVLTVILPQTLLRI